MREHPTREQHEEQRVLLVGKQRERRRSEYEAFLQRASNI